VDAFASVRPEVSCRERRALFAAVLAAGMLAAQSPTRADPPADGARRARAVATLGPTRIVTVGELEDRIAALPPFQRASLGADAAAVRRAFLVQVLLPEALESLGGEGEKLDRLQPTSYQLERARSQSVVRAIRARLGPASAIPLEDVQKYYDDNRVRYDAPERYQIWRILCKTREEAQSVLDAARRDPTPKAFGELARDHSIDKASNLRDGNLGFISPDGTSKEPGLRVDVSIVRAAQGVQDGQLVATPVPEGDGFSVVWRRGTLAATRRTVDQAASQIRDILWKTRVKEATDGLVADLRATRLHDLNVSLLATLGATPPTDAGGASGQGGIFALPAPKN
jgi:peptidyl-prolyl cis-trans isomerase C